jgi:hypothetical protein
MRARVWKTIGGLGFAGLTLSGIAHAGGLTVVICCLALLGLFAFGFAFGRWVLGETERTARLVAVVRAIRESDGPAPGSGGKAVAKRED